ncbi:hypothetical protein Tco_1161038, partial [Tanacetum coccineum]
CNKYTLIDENTDEEFENKNIIDDTNEQDEAGIDIQHSQSVSDEDMDEEDDLDDFIDDANVDDDVTDDEDIFDYRNTTWKII